LQCATTAPGADMLAAHRQARPSSVSRWPRKSVLNMPRVAPVVLPQAAGGPCNTNNATQALPRPAVVS